MVISAAKPCPSTLSTVATRPNTSPTVWAKRFGGPGTSFSLRQSLGTMTWTASRPNGEYLGPPATRRAKPSATIAYRHHWLTAIDAKASAMTRPAVARAA
jgi:hypothetical protein